LLEAGANPNSMDSGRPVWWQALEGPSSDEKLRALTILLDHGADLTKRDTENGPVGWAADRKDWRAVWLLIERGAAWKDERSYGTPVAQILAWDLESRRGTNSEIPEEMLKLAAMYDIERTAR